MVRVMVHSLRDSALTLPIVVGLSLVPLLLDGAAAAPLGTLPVWAFLAPAAELPPRPTRSFAPPPQVDYCQPAREYVERTAGGWTFQLERELVERYPDRAAQVVHRLEAKLAATLLLLPECAREPLRGLSLFVMLGPEATHGGRDNGAEFFRQIDPDFHAHLDPRWRRAIVLYSAANYLQQDEHWSVQVLLHEMAHAWHLERWPEKQPDVLAAWQNARDRGLYHNVRDVNGTVIPIAYALQNQLEYFAELSCIYFWRGEYEPLDRAALQRYDPVGFALIEKLWGVCDPPLPRSPRAGQTE
jgi:hypothetical protein